LRNHDICISMIPISDIVIKAMIMGKILFTGYKMKKKIGFAKILSQEAPTMA
jgi:hypothetical protein